MRIRDIINLVESLSGATISFDSLPPDMQDIIDQFISNGGYQTPSSLPLVAIDVDLLDRTGAELDDEGEVYSDEAVYDSDRGVDRGQLYAREMNIAKTPPVVIADGWLIDGRHRLWQAKRSGVKTLMAIDLTGLMHPVHQGMAHVPEDAISR